MLFLFRWCSFRLLIGAGMSKLGQASSSCWRELTCTTTHYYTQPMPNPLAYYAHHLPAYIHHAEVALTFFEQLVLPFLLLIPVRPVRVFAAWAAVFFQVGIVSTGNYAWINFIGALPTLSCLDDAALSALFPRAAANAAKEAALEEAGLAPRTEAEGSALGRQPRRPLHVLRRACAWGGRRMRAVVHTVLVCFIMCKSAAPLKELFTPAPWLHYYDDFFFVNAQGVFGFINAHRPMLILSYTHDALPPLPDLDDSDCQDARGPVANDQHGRALACSDLAAFCSRQAQVPTLCPRTCGNCPSPAAALADSLAWQELELANLPGRPGKAPSFNSPYHYRLDWEVDLPRPTPQMPGLRSPALAPCIRCASLRTRAPRVAAQKG